MNEHHYRLVLEDLTEVICRFRPDGTCLFVNDVYCRFFGKSREEIVGRGWQFQVAPEDVDAIEDALRAMTPDNPVAFIANRVRSATGEYRWMEFINRGFFDASGRLVEIQAVGRDITARRALEDDLRRYRQRILSLEEELRREIARELHDAVGTSIAALGIHLSMVSDGLSEESRVRVTDRLDDCRRLLTEVSGLVRNLHASLRPPMLEDCGLAAALRWYAERIAETGALQIEVFADESVPRLPGDGETTLFRIAQEALANVLKHAEARQVRIELTREDDRIRLAVRDDGKGFRPAVPGSGGNAGWGLTSMRERAEMLGGRLTVDSTPGRGTVVAALVPEKQ